MSATLACRQLLFINMKMLTDSDSTTLPAGSSASMAKALSILLIVGQVGLAIGFIAFLLMASFMAIPSLRESFTLDLPNNLSSSTMAGLCLSGSIVAAGWFYVLRLLRRVVATVIHGDPFMPENVARLRNIWVMIAATEVFRMISNFIFGSIEGDAGVDGSRLDIRIWAWFFIFIIAVISEAFRHGAALRAEQELTI